jgi:GGDEF domain-containing protein
MAIAVSIPKRSHVDPSRVIPTLAIMLAIFIAMPWLIRPLERWVGPGGAALIGSIGESIVGIALGLWLIQLIQRQNETLGRLEGDLERLSHGDPMTGLGNASALTRDLEIALGRARRTGEPLAMLLLDIEDLERVNRVKGSAAGDKTLRSLAAVLRSSVRFGTDAGYRIGDDEFAMVLTGDRAAAEHVRQRLECNFLERSPGHSRFHSGLVMWDGCCGAQGLLELARRELVAQRQSLLTARMA